jgi:Protein of unknown function (DUF3352)
MICPQCGARNEPGGKFCVRCGTPMPTNATPAGYPGAGSVSQPVSAPPPPLEDFVIVSEGQAPPPAPPQWAPPPPAPAPQWQAPPPPQQWQAPPPQQQWQAPPPQQFARGPAQPARKSHTLRNVLLAIALLAIVGVGAGGYLLYQTLNKPSIAVSKLIPADAYGYLSIVPAPKGAQKASIDKLQDAFRSQPGFQAAWDKVFSDTATASNPVKGIIGDCGGSATPVAGTTPGTFDDVASYLGDNVSFAMLPLTKDELLQMQNGGDPEKLLLPKLLFFVDLDFNPLNKKGIIQKLKEWSDKPDTTTLVEKYRDVEIRKLPTDKCSAQADPGAPSLFMALVSGTAALALDAQPLRGVIDRSKDGHGLQENAAFAAMDAELPKDRLGTLYLNLSSIYDTVQAIAPADPSDPMTKLRVDGAVSMVASAHDDGVQIDAVSDMQVNGQALGVTTVPAAGALNDVPAGSWAAFSGADLKATIQQMLDLYRKQGMSDQINQSFADLKEQTGIDFEKDLLPLLSGEYALSAQPGKAAAGADSPSVGVVAQLRMANGEGPRMAGLLDTLNKSFTDQGATVTPVQVGGATLFQNDVSPEALYGVAGDKLYIVGESSPEGATAFATDALAAQGKGLGTDKTVQARLAKLPAGSNTTLYVDISKIRVEGVEASMPADSRSDYDTTFAPFVKPFQYLLFGGATTAKNGAAHTRTVLFLGIGK